MQAVLYKPVLERAAVVYSNENFCPYLGLFALKRADQQVNHWLNRTPPEGDIPIWKWGVVSHFTPEKNKKGYLA